ncbi:MAG: diflavin oxidoreductase [Akkermansiaceae bacterium]
MITFPAHAPIADDQKLRLSSALHGLDGKQLSWLSGFLVNAEPVSAEPIKLTVLYGTESGNSEELAEKLFKEGKKQGFKVSISNMADISPSALTMAGKLLVVVSTWGDGEPPEAAEEFYNALLKENISLTEVEYSVCALGDSSYEQFCQTGKEIDARLEKLGATRFLERADCDVDFDEPFSAWQQQVWAELAGAAPAQSAPQAASSPGITYGRNHPFPAEVLDNQLLSGERSAKETIHLELSLEGSGMDYQPGDVLAVIPRNAEDVVDAILAETKLSPDAQVEVKGVGEKSLRHALIEDLDVTALSRKVAKAWQALGGSDELLGLLSDEKKEDFKEWVYGRELIDLLETYPVSSLDAQSFVSLLRKLPPRLYSIASSPVAHPNEVHLTVAAVRYKSHGKSRKGVASTYLADQAGVGGKVTAYIHANKNFRLPDDPQTPIIMIGPGTGVAPFRAFVEHRGESSGDAWLFFGDQCYNEDFLYQTEWQEHLKEGSLTRLDVAFSRDQPEKVYVQHKMLENRTEIWKWLERGAHFYVCGDASRMAKDVHQALLDIVKSEGRVDDPDAFLADLKKSRRYQRDVY